MALVLDLDRQHIIKGLAGGSFLFISDGRCIGQIVGHDIHSVLFVYHTGASGIQVAIGTGKYVEFLAGYRE